MSSSTLTFGGRFFIQRGEFFWLKKRLSGYTCYNMTIYPFILEGVPMKRQLYYIQIFAILTLFWAILRESFSVQSLLFGLLISVITVFSSEKFLLKDSYYDRYPYHIIHMIVYGFFLIIEIYKAGLSVALSIITGNINIDVVDITTDINDPYKKSILANSITLTPGTVTLDMNGNLIKVLWLNTQTKQPIIAGKMIKGQLERRL